MNPKSQEAPLVADRSRGSVWVRRRELIFFSLLVWLPPVLAWVYFLGFGLPPTSGNADPANPHGPHPFPVWVRGSHYLNLLLTVLLLRSGWRLLMDRPQLYWNGQAKPGTEWARWGPDEVAPQAGSTEYWHHLTAVGWTLTGVVYVSLVIATGQWQRVVPTTWAVLTEAWSVFVQYCTFHLPLDPDGYWRYNSLQLLSYTVVVFVFCPILVLTGLAISPPIAGGFPWLPRLFGNREAARSIHFLITIGYLAFVAVHVFFVVLYAFWLNLNHIVLGTDETGLPGGLIGAVGIGLIVLVAVASNRLFSSRG